MKKYNIEKNKTDKTMILLVLLLIIVGYFIVTDSKASEPMDSDGLFPVITYHNQSSNEVMVRMSDNHTITIILEEGETADDYIITYYKGDYKFITFSNKFFDYLINSNDENLYRYYYYLNGTSYLVD